MQNHTLTYRMMRKSLICALLLAAAMLSVQAAQATVNATSTTRNIAINRTASVQVTWRVQQQLYIPASQFLPGCSIHTEWPCIA